jgi:hypothetical protein
LRKSQFISTGTAGQAIEVMEIEDIKADELLLDHRNWP